MKKILFRLVIFIGSLILIASVGYKYKISKIDIHKALKMRGYNFTERNKIESKTNGFLRALKNRKLASNFLLDKKSVNLLKNILDKKCAYFFTIENVEVEKNNAYVHLKITTRVEKGENKGLVKENFCKILFTFSQNQWKISDTKDFINNIKTDKKMKERILRKPLNNQIKRGG